MAKTFLRIVKRKKDIKKMLLLFDWEDVTQKRVLPAFTCADSCSPGFSG